MTGGLPRLMLAAPRSGGGKTTLTCALLQSLVNRGLSPGAFKCGPDYIDPMFHTRVLGLPSRSLDLFFGEESLVGGLLCRHGAGRSPLVMEGVMGYYDGLGGHSDCASSWHLAHATSTPVLLVVEAGGASLTLAALVKGLCAFREPHHIAGLLLNRCPPALHASLAPMLERETGLPVLGHLPPLPHCSFESRHLGLIPAHEIPGLQAKLQELAGALEQCADVDALLELAGSAPPLEGALPALTPVTDTRPVVAVAHDQAFCFYYDDNLDILRGLGAELSFFSPCFDKTLPPNASALYLGGGYPELHCPALSQNAPMRRAIREAVAGGLPTLAECGGFQYLQRHLIDQEGKSWPMAGLLEGGSFPIPAQGPRRFGYLTLTTRQDTLLGPAGTTLRGHEFHRWDSSQCGHACLAQKPLSTVSWDCVVAGERLWAGYPHLYFYSNLSSAARFVRAAEEYQRSRYGL